MENYKIFFENYKNPSEFNLKENCENFNDFLGKIQ